jgi:hypothetical protein
VYKCVDWMPIHYFWAFVVVGATRLGYSRVALQRDFAKRFVPGLMEVHAYMCVNCK